MKITNQVVEKHGLKLEEYSIIKKLLKREPNFLELGKQVLFLRTQLMGCSR